MSERGLGVCSGASVVGFGAGFGRENARKMQVDLSKVDLAVISHGHYDHGGGQLVIDEELELFSGVNGTRLNPSGNKDLFMKDGESFKLDDFFHEQNLIIKENGNTVLVAGCAHNGIVNIMEHFYADKNSHPSHIIGGFHLYNRSADQYEKPSAKPSHSPMVFIK